MNKRSYLDNLNAGRERRSAAVMDEISRRLDHLEGRLERVFSQAERESEEDPWTQPHRRERPVQVRAQQSHPSSVGGLSAELKALRQDMRAMMDSGLRREFEMLREELSGITAMLPHSSLTRELNEEFERLSRSIEQLAQRSDDKNVKLLRLELEQVKGALTSLAREDSVRSLDRRWDDLEARLSTSRQDPAIEGLRARVEEIGDSVARLPESLSLRSLDERVRSLAASLEQLLRQRDRKPDLHSMIEERLDEISRAITASAAVARSSSLDSRLFERVEARVAALAEQITELAEDRPSGVVLERLNTLSERVDDIARTMSIPEEALDRLSYNLAAFAEKLEVFPLPPEADQQLRSFENRFAQLAEVIERRQENAIEQSQALFQELERRLQDMASRFFAGPSAAEGRDKLIAAIDNRFAELAGLIDDARGETLDRSALRTLENRIEDMAERLQSAVSERPGVDPGIIRNLEAQVANLAAKLNQPSREAAEIRELAPRLEKIERSIGEGRSAVLSAARQVAEEAVQALRIERPESIDERLKEDLRKLEALTRKSDERNTRTFEAIHDTLIKIVERVGAMETGGGFASSAIARTPSIDPSAAGQRSLVADEMTPAEAAAAAARAALLDDADAGLLPRQRKRKARAIGRGSDARDDLAREEPVFSASAEGAREPQIDPRMNEPLEPGSGAPDLNAIMRRVRDDRGTRTPEAAETAKADFIAAARRAAQAAAAEAEILKKDHQQPAQKESGKGLRGILGRRKKQMLLTMTAAAVIAGGAYYATMIVPADFGTRLAAHLKPAPTLKAETAAKAAKPAAEARTVRRIEPEEPAAEIKTGAITRQTQAKPATAKTGEAAPVLPSSLSSSEPPAEKMQQPAPLPALSEIPVEAGPVTLREAAAEGNAAALFEIGNRYAEGHGVEADMTKAADWYLKAAELGLAPAQYRIGNFHEKGVGVERNIAKAKMWYQMAAEQGNVSAMHNLAVLFATGADGVTDNESAARWFIEAAERGVTDSQFNLGILSARGVGVPRDLTESYKWFDIVARTGDKDAAAKRDEVANAMSPEDLARAKGKAKLWKVREAQPAANVVNVPEAWTEDQIVTGGIDMKRAVTNIQLILNKNGFDAGPADGVMGERTRLAIKAFQKKNGMGETGEVDDQLVDALLKLNQATQ